MIDLVDSLVDTALAWAELFGLPVLFLIFVSKGMLVGKIFPTSVFLPGYVIVTGASTTWALVIAAVTAVGYIIGQYVVFRGIRTYGVTFLGRLPYATVDPDDERFGQFDEWFRTYGGPSIFVTNFVPWIRGLVTIPAATSSYPTGQYLLYTGSSTVLYHLVYVGLALAGLEVVTRAT